MWVGGEARGREGKRNAPSDGGPEVLKRSCWHGGQRPFSSVGATTSRFALWEALCWCSDAGEEYTYVQQPGTTAVLMLVFTPYLCLSPAGAVFLITGMNLCIWWFAYLCLVVYCNAPNLFMSMDNSSTSAKCLSSPAGKLWYIMEKMNVYIH